MWSPRTTAVRVLPPSRQVICALPSRATASRSPDVQAETLSDAPADAGMHASAKALRMSMRQLRCTGLPLPSWPTLLSTVARRRRISERECGSLTKAFEKAHGCSQFLAAPQHAAVAHAARDAVGVETLEQALGDAPARAQLVAQLGQRDRLVRVAARDHSFARLGEAFARVGQVASEADDPPAALECGAERRELALGP